jgi:hypothetical protein
VVAHAAFSHQHALHIEIMDLWTEWAKRERTDLYRGILT